MIALFSDRKNRVMGRAEDPCALGFVARCTVMFASVLAAELILFCLTGQTQAWAQSVAAQSSAAQSSPAPSITVKRGLSDEFRFFHSSSTLRAVGDQSIDAPVLVRLERSSRDNQGSEYTLRFFGAVAGTYDLSDFVVESDGSSLSADNALPSMIVRIVSELPPGHGTSLYEIDDPTLHAPSGYRFGLVLFGLAWIAVPIVRLIVHWRSRQPVVEETPAREPTLSDHLRPLIQRASQGQMTVKEQSRLELLVYVFWQRRLDLPESLIEALPVMRRHAEAGGLLRSLEAWIHDDDAARAELSPQAMDALLEPYREIPAEDDAFDHGFDSASVSGGVA